MYLYRLNNVTIKHALVYSHSTRVDTMIITVAAVTLLKIKAIPWSVADSFAVRRILFADDDKHARTERN